MDTMGYSESFRRLTKPVGDSGFRLSFLQNIKDNMVKNARDVDTSSGVVNGALTYTDKEAINYVLRDAYTSEVRESIYSAGREHTYKDIQELVNELSDKEYGIVVGTIVYGLIQVNKLDIGDNRKEVVKKIFKLQGL